MKIRQEERRDPKSKPHSKLGRDYYTRDSGAIVFDERKMERRKK